MAKSSKPKRSSTPELLSVTFKLNGKIHAVAFSDSKKVQGGPRRRVGVTRAAAGPPGASPTQCINGTLHVELCLGTDCRWVDTGIPCQ